MRASNKWVAFLTCTLILFLIVSSASAYVGDGTLYVYIDLYTTEAPLDTPPPHTYLVNPSQIIWIQIAGITEFTFPDLVRVKICFDVGAADYSLTFSDVPVHVLGSGVGAGENGVGDADHPIAWAVGQYDDPPPGGFVEIVFSSTITVHYKNNDGSGTEYVANGLIARVGHIHVIPQIPWGTIGPSFVFLIGLVVFVRARKKQR